ncbi:MAG: glutamate--tRNA ligase [Gammaproteobacteria bacterium]|nr:MAG: glutamate--tRNA ligase [Pseudomonadota bacterium]MBC6945358.1 glutamate--tRNA ligase [Gammaproteobacteria bacterium]MCE7897326.1 glutamate--tRNA ligase [Gammaproteobacteria bacterium PRO8]MCQ3935332.1 glutamate--tRNA ligase [Gammaproteobacteria bacterium]MDL1880508.1 glutamate--tRNA ligase [Gammaproteobacteria bacterium PRO2]
MRVKTRFAPSPTGYLHIGGVRTALFSWLYARHHGGSFVLRIEDTDRERSTEASIQAILTGMAWVGLDYDEGPFRQTERFERYTTVAAEMLARGTAYRCYCSRDELEAMRAEQVARGENPRYDGRCRDRQAPVAGVNPVIRLRSPREGSVTVHDLVRGDVSFSNADLDDVILMRSDGVPTFHFGVVVDDADMGITHVIRGDDHLNNTPRHIHIQQALGVPVPVYAHLPMILGADGTRLSKRHGAVNVLEYRERGYLPDALLNYLVRLGWSHGDQEVFSREEMIELFDIAAVNAAASRFNPDKLGWLNQQYILARDRSQLAAEFGAFMDLRGLEHDQGPPLEQVVDAYRERAVTLEDMAQASTYVFHDFAAIDAKAARQHLKAGTVPVLSQVIERLEALPGWQREVIHDVLQAVAAALGIGFGKVGQPVRVAITGGTVSPPIDVTLQLIGRERVLHRLRQALQLAQAQPPVS